MSDTITLKAKTAVTHDTNHYVFSRPDAFDFEPGQAAALTLDVDGWRDDDRPFTFTSLPDDDDLEFVIKTYPDHNGMTEQLAKIEPGAQVKLDGPFGAITDHGPGTFIAAGAGITPFIPILRLRARDGHLDGSTLMFSNKTADDIILRGEWEATEGLRTILTVTDEKAEGLHDGKIDKAFLEREIPNFDQNFYLCGPGGFVDDIRDALKELGADEESIITEEGW